MLPARIGGKYFFFILSEGWESFNEDMIGGIVQVLHARAFRSKLNSGLIELLNGPIGVSL
jgi:hypothetical protein